MDDKTVLDFQARLRKRLAEEREVYDRMDRGAANVLILAEAIKAMRDGGSDSGEIAATLRIAADELRHDGA